MEKNVIKQNLTPTKGKAKKISADSSLSKETPKGSSKKTTPSTKMDGEDFLADSPKFSRASKGKRPGKKMDAEGYLSDSKFMKSFEGFVNEVWVNSDETNGEIGPGQDDHNISHQVDPIENDHLNTPVVDDRGGIENKTYLEISNGTLKLTDNKENAHCFLDDSEADDFAAVHKIKTYQLEMDNSGENFTIMGLNNLDGAIITTRDSEEDNFNFNDDAHDTIPGTMANTPFQYIKRPIDFDTQG